MLCIICFIITGFYRPVNDVISAKKWAHLPEVCGLNRFDNRMQGGRIVNGQVARLGQFPWMAKLGVKLTETQVYFFCGGSLITKFFVVSAAHCEEHGDVVRLGDNDESTEVDCDRYGNCAPPHQDIDIQEYYFKNFCTVTLENDIVLIQLKKPAVFNEYVWPICLPTKTISPRELVGHPIWLSGWGKINSKYNSYSDQLLYVTVSVVNKSYCNAFYDPQIKVSQFCVGDRRGKSTCEGDSGGPAAVYLPMGNQFRAHLVGITSAGQERCEIGYTVYTNVSYYMDWIISTTRRKTQ